MPLHFGKWLRKGDTEGPSLEQVMHQGYQVWRLTRLLVVPATSAMAERSFSALCRLKTYLIAGYDWPAETEQLVDTALPPGQS